MGFTGCGRATSPPLGEKSQTDSLLTYYWYGGTEKSNITSSYGDTAVYEPPGFRKPLALASVDDLIGVM